ncbi:MAG: SAM-dependent chlorinase/fluorinase [Acidobacteriota bacterium]
MARPVVALLTDFGTKDHYAGTMKGVVLSICPDASLVDVSHEVPAHDVLAGALELAASYQYFPPGTVFLVVVDPGVGSSRLGVAAEAGSFRFVAPDNGVLTAVFAETPPKKVVAISERKYARPTISKTFEGRDRFAPAAAWLARGVGITALGRPVKDFHVLDLPTPEFAENRIVGTVLRADRFGNLITNIPRAAVDQLLKGEAAIRVLAGRFPIEHVVATYAEAPEGAPCALYGSTDHLEIALNGGSASAALALAAGAVVEVVRA